MYLFLCSFTSLPVLTDVTLVGHLLKQRSATHSDRRTVTHPATKTNVLTWLGLNNPLTDKIRQYSKNSKKPCLFTLPSYTSGTCVLQTRYLSILLFTAVGLYGLDKIYECIHCTLTWLHWLCIEIKMKF